MLYFPRVTPQARHVAAKVHVVGRSSLNFFNYSSLVIPQGHVSSRDRSPHHGTRRRPSGLAEGDACQAVRRCAAGWGRRNCLRVPGIPSPARSPLPCVIPSGDLPCHLASHMGTPISPLYIPAVQRAGTRPLQAEELPVGPGSRRPSTREQTVRRSVLVDGLVRSVIVVYQGHRVVGVHGLEVD